MASGAASEAPIGGEQLDSLDMCVDLPDALDALMTDVAPPKDTFMRLGSCRGQFSREGSNAASAAHVDEDGGAAAQGGAPTGGDGAPPLAADEAAEEAQGAPATDAQAKEGFQAEFKLMGVKMVEMLTHAHVQPPPLPADFMAMPVDGPTDGNADEGALAHEPELKGGILDDDDRRTTPLSVSAPLSAGTAYSKFSRIRGTVNSYVDKMTAPTWFKDIVLGTVHALARRLGNRGEADIMNKAPYDVQAAYKQFMVRVKAIIELHKSIKTWTESPDNDALDAMLKPFAVLLGYHITVDGYMNEELNIICNYAIFKGIIKQQVSVSAAMSKRDAQALAHMVALRDRLIQALPEPPATAAAAVTVKTEGGGRAAQGAAAAESAAARPTKKPRRTKRATEDAQGKVVRGQTPLFYMATMVSDGINAWLSDLGGAAIADDGQVCVVIREICGAQEQWAAKAKQIETSVEDATFSEVLKSAVTIAMCAHPMERLRPATALARKARRVIAEQVKQPSSPAPELARSMCAYPAPKLLMEASRLHVNQSIVDDAATSAFKATSASFENHFSQLFDDALQWKDAMLHSIADHTDGGFVGIQLLFAGMGPFFTGAYSLLLKWFTASAQENVTFFVVNVQNSFEVLEIGKYMIVEIYWACAGFTCASMGNLLLESISKRGASKPDEEEAADQERLEQTAAELNTYAAAIDIFIDSLPRFSNTLKDLYERLLKCRNLAHQRMGDIFISEFGEEHKAMNPIKYETELTYVVNLCTDMPTYLKYCLDLAGALIHDTTDAGREKFTNDIIKFAGLQRIVDDETWSNLLGAFVETSIADSARVELVRSIFGDFKDVVGSQVYTVCSDSFVAARMADIAPTLNFTIGIVSEQAIAEGQCGAAFDRLVLAHGPLESLFPLGVSFEDGGEKDEKALQTSKHYMSLSDLVSFLEASGVASISVPGVTINDGN
ncbi:unnamed protein product [Prorocentrum cordatum]|uniref:Exocyst complex component Sec6 n=1 Tax=Prorocentrum cordatum TaxID=2364126 RepID=A0ABN9T4Z8_9DINO|nr:unnamed protein product [Polarella glacialis]